MKSHKHPHFCLCWQIFLPSKQIHASIIVGVSSNPLQRITSRNHSSSITTIHTSIGTDRLYFIRNRWDRIETIVRHTTIINTGQTRGLSIAVDIGSKESVFLLKEVGIRDRKFGVSIEAVDPNSLTNCIRLSMYRNLQHRITSISLRKVMQRKWWNFKDYIISIGLGHSRLTGLEELHI